jgi:prephenate dehydratase
MASTTLTATKKQMDISTKKVCIQGYAGAFHEIAARLNFQSEEINVVPAHTFDDLVQKIEEQEEADLGLMAIENTLGGNLMYNYQLLLQSKLSITGEVLLRIKQNLLTLPNTNMKDLTEVHSHPMAIAQCRVFFKQYPHIKLVENADTALSARMVQEQQKKNIGAIASTLAAELYELDILKEGIETNKQNLTRFLILEHEDKVQKIADANKVSLCFSTSHEVGSLHKILAVLSAYNANLTKITSAPIIGSPWKYMFYVDFVTSEIGYQQAINAIQPITKNMKVLGIYKKGESFEY